MRKDGLYPVSIRRYWPGRSLSVRVQYSPDELKQEFVSHEPGKILVRNITYIRTNIGWVYLAIVMDLYNREVLGYSVSQNIDIELVKRALGNALPETEVLKAQYFILTEEPSTIVRVIKGC